MGKRSAGRKRPRLLLLGAALVAVSLGAGAAVAHWERTAAVPLSEALLPAAPDLTPAPRPTPPAPPAPTARPGGPSGATGGSSSAGAAPDAPVRPSTPPPRKPTPPADVPVSGVGTFTTARSSGSPVGSGPLRRYRVEVENGIDVVPGASVSAAEAAAEIEQILAHPRSWAAHGRGSFQLVSAGAEADFVIRIATPDTADELCLAEGLNTGGQLNCETTDGVVVNLRRWVLGSPTFSGPPSEYRHLIINHEVGHEIGIRDHMGCPGTGEPAPVMMQQIKGLKGCVSNAWPYDSDGSYITGPAIP
ncbi:DUF3152 domain-containing protein [Streptomyces sp. NPDC054841]